MHRTDVSLLKKAWANQQPDITEHVHVGIRRHKWQNSTQSGLITKVTCCWLIFFRDREALTTQ